MELSCCSCGRAASVEIIEKSETYEMEVESEMIAEFKVGIKNMNSVTTKWLKTISLLKSDIVEFSEELIVLESFVEVTAPSLLDETELKQRVEEASLKFNKLYDAMKFLIPNMETQKKKKKKE